MLIEKEMILQKMEQTNSRISITKEKGAMHKDMEEAIVLKSELRPILDKMNRNNRTRLYCRDAISLR